MRPSYLLAATCLITFTHATVISLDRRDAIDVDEGDDLVGAINLGAWESTLTWLTGSPVDLVPRNNESTQNEEFSNLHKRKLNNICTDPKKGPIVANELTISYVMLLNAYNALNTPNANHRRWFFAPDPPESTKYTNFLHQILGGKAALMDPSTDYTVDVTCDEDNDNCRQGAFAWTNIRTKRINFCDKWFNEAKRPETAKVQCDPEKKKNLNAYVSRAKTVLHELMHVLYPEHLVQIAHGSDAQTRASTPADCLKLAAGRFPDSEGKMEPAVASFVNADSYAWAILGAWYALPERCDYDVPPV